MGQGCRVESASKKKKKFARAGTGPQRNCLKEPVVTALKSLYYKGSSKFDLVGRFSLAQWFRMAFADGGYFRVAVRVRICAVVPFLPFPGKKT